MKRRASDKSKIDVMNDFFTDTKNINGVHDLINSLQLSEYDKRLLRLKYTIVTPNGQTNPHKVIANEIGVCETYITDKLNTALLNAYEALKHWKINLK